jgi:hypothetical protein
VRLAEETGTGRYFTVDTEEPLPSEPALASQLWDQARELTGVG